MLNSTQRFRMDAELGKEKYSQAGSTQYPPPGQPQMRTIQDSSLTVNFSLATTTDIEINMKDNMRSLSASGGATSYQIRFDLSYRYRSLLNGIFPKDANEAHLFGWQWGGVIDPWWFDWIGFRIEC